MEEFYPSEIARLVLGYLKETKCKQTWQAFMSESENLSEYFSLYRKGKLYSTNVNGKCLLDILKEYCALKSEIIRNKQKSTFSLKHSSLNEGIKGKADAVSDTFHQHEPSICYDGISNIADKNSTEERNSRLSTEKKIENFVSPKITEVCTLNEEGFMDCTDNFSNASFKKVARHEEEDNDVIIIENPVYSEIKLEEGEEHNDNMSIADVENILANIAKEPLASKNIPLSEFMPSVRKETIGIKNPVYPEIKLEEEEECSDNNNNMPITNVENMVADTQNIAKEPLVSKNIPLPDFTPSVKKEVISPELSIKSIENINRSDSTCLSTSIPVITSAQSCSSSLKTNQNLALSPFILPGSNLLNNQSSFAITTNSFPCEYNSVNQFPVSNIPTYILTNFPSGASFVQNNVPYQFLINTPNNAMPAENISPNLGSGSSLTSTPALTSTPVLTSTPLNNVVSSTVSEVVKNVSSSLFSEVEDGRADASSTTPILHATTAVNGSISDAVTINSKEKRKSKKALSSKNGCIHLEKTLKTNSKKSENKKEKNSRNVTSSLKDTCDSKKMDSPNPEQKGNSLQAQLISNVSSTKINTSRQLQILPKVSSNGHISSPKKTKKRKHQILPKVSSNRQSPAKVKKSSLQSRCKAIEVNLFQSPSLLSRKSSSSATVGCKSSNFK